jgi:hypothetical protein
MPNATTAHSGLEKTAPQPLVVKSPKNPSFLLCKEDKHILTLKGIKIKGILHKV